MKVLGDCSQCGGLVTVPTNWLGIYPPTPSCQSCGAVVPRRTVQTVRPEKAVDMVQATDLERMLDFLKR